MDLCEILMPESDTPLVDYYPSGWHEEVHSPEYVEWIYSGDETIKVRLKVDETPPNYYVSAITGINDRGEEYVANEISDLGVRQAFDVAKGLVYAMNGAIGRSDGVAEFCGDL
jgi:hypothetical protein